MICHSEARFPEPKNPEAGAGVAAEFRDNGVLMKTYYVYIMTNKRNGTLYVGVTNNLTRRVYEHKQKLVPGFTSKYNLTLLVYYELVNDVRDAIAREKQIKGWLRIRKKALIDSLNGEWKDLAESIT